MIKSVLVGIANESEQNILVETIQSWDPQKISFLGETVFFKVDDKFYSMKKSDFCTIFTEKCVFIKY